VEPHPGVLRYVVSRLVIRRTEANAGLLTVLLRSMSRMCANFAAAADVDDVVIVLFVIFV
jgi:phage terminase large subunit-like protein